MFTGTSVNPIGNYLPEAEPVPFAREQNRTSFV